MAKRPDPSEQGFVLIAAIWLLILGGSVVAVLMVRAISSARAASSGVEALKQKATLDAATETVWADILFNGNRSQWASLPATGPMTLYGMSVSVAVTNEAQRIDVNEGDPKLIDETLREHGVDVTSRQSFRSLLSAKQSAGLRIGSMDDLRGVLRKSGIGQGAAGCLTDMLTVFGGVTTALPQRPVARTIQPGDALRVEVRVGISRRLRSIARIAGLRNDPLVVSARELRGICE